MRVLAFGASGRVAGLVVPALAARGATVRAFIRNDADTEKVRAAGAAEVAVGDLTNRDSVERALEGVDRVFYLGPVFMPGEIEAGRGVVSACMSAGVKRICFSSVIHPVISGLPNHAAKAAVEEAILGTTLEYTFLHPALFFQNFAKSWKRVASEGVLAEPWSTENRFSRVDYRDVAEVAAIALTEDRLLYGTFELCADGWLNRHEVAALAADVLGRDVRAMRVDPETLGADAEPMRPMFGHYDRAGLRGSPLCLQTILGHPPRTLRAFFAELAAGHRGDGA